ncbi:hypothetical protein P7C71_g6038, partial [Lecanoromycetidae sp. Uapishka_2]
MGSTQFGNFHNFCRDSTLPVCNLFLESPTQSNTGSQLEGAGFKGCALTGIALKNGRNLSNLAFFVGTGFIALDTAFSYTNTFVSSLDPPNNRNIALYVLYQLWPLICLAGFFLLETILVLRVLGEMKPMQYLIGAALLFAIGQVFQYVISTHICHGTGGKIDGALFETLFTLLSVVMLWVFWSSITEDDWPMPASGESAYT